MLTLLNIPDDSLSHILQHLHAADLWRLGTVCRKWHGKHPEENVVQREFKERDDAMILSKQYPPESPIFAVFDCRRRVFSFELCSSFAWEMSREAQRRESQGRYGSDSECKYQNLHSSIPHLSDGLRDGKIYLFFAQVTRYDKLLWEGFLRDYNPLSDFICPMNELLRQPNGELSEINDVLGAEAGKEWRIHVESNRLGASDRRFHLDTGNISNLKRDYLNSDLRMTLVSLICSPEQPGLQPEQRLQYSSHGNPSRSSSSSHNSPSFDVLRDQNVTTYREENDDFATAICIWKSGACLHSFSLLYTVTDHDDGYSDYDDYGWRKDDSGRRGFGDWHGNDSEDDGIYWYDEE